MPVREAICEKKGIRRKKSAVGSNKNIDEINALTIPHCEIIFILSEKSLCIFSALSVGRHTGMSFFVLNNALVSK